MHLSVTIIGVVYSSLKDIKDCPLQESENAPAATLLIYSEYAEGISNIKTGDELIVLSWLHRAERNVLKTKPRNDESAKLTGVFSTRSPARPNPIGMHTVKVLSVNDCEIRVSHLELLDGTPLLDIKPHL